ncbi:hypothetical protein Q8A73_017706 [Channa argus]|nr:hypothetical protein Q8A73_017706 [Channa argus]
MVWKQGIYNRNKMLIEGMARADPLQRGRGEGQDRENCSNTSQGTTLGNQQSNTCPARCGRSEQTGGADTTAADAQDPASVLSGSLTHTAPTKCQSAQSARRRFISLRGVTNATRRCHQAHMQSMMANHTATTPAMVHCLDLKGLDVVGPRATHTNRQVPTLQEKHFLELD